MGKIDKDGDGQVTEQELKDWIQYVQKRYIVTDTDRMWKDHSIEGDKLSWSAYKQRTYGSDDGKYSFFVFLFSYQFHMKWKWDNENRISSWCIMSPWINIYWYIV